LGRNGAALSLKTSFTYFGDYIIETHVDGDEVHYNMIKNEWATPQATPLQDTTLQTNLILSAEAPVDEMKGNDDMKASAEKPRRGLHAFIRGAWTFTFAAMGEGLTYLVNNTTSLNLPPGVGTAVGAGAAGLAYGIKKYVAPDTVI
jgi:hypothetical protein